MFSASNKLNGIAICVDRSSSPIHSSPLYYRAIQLFIRIWEPGWHKKLCQQNKLVGTWRRLPGWSTPPATRSQSRPPGGWRSDQPDCSCWQHTNHTARLVRIPFDELIKFSLKTNRGLLVSYLTHRERALRVQLWKHYIFRILHLVNNLCGTPGVYVKGVSGVNAPRRPDRDQA